MKPRRRPSADTAMRKAALTTVPRAVCSRRVRPRRSMLREARTASSAVSSRLGSAASGARMGGRGSAIAAKVASSAPAARRMSPDASHPDLPALAVLVAAGPEPLRLRWLLNALEEQDSGRGRVEAVIVAPGGRLDRLVADHPLVASGVARLVQAPASAGLAAARNAGWRAARAPAVAFLDEHVRPSD